MNPLSDWAVRLVLIGYGTYVLMSSVRRIRARRGQHLTGNALTIHRIDIWVCRSMITAGCGLVIVVVADIVNGPPWMLTVGGAVIVVAFAMTIVSNFLLGWYEGKSG